MTRFSTNQLKNLHDWTKKINKINSTLTLNRSISLCCFKVNLTLEKLLNKQTELSFKIKSN